MRETLLLIDKASNHAIPGDSKLVLVIKTYQNNLRSWVAVAKTSRNLRIFLAEGESRRLDIGPKQMTFPSKVRILVLFKKRFLLKKTINRKLQRQKASKFTNL